MEISRITSQCGNVGNSTKEITCTNSMSDNLVLLKNGFVVLGVFRGLMAIGATPRLFHKITSAFQVAFVACHLIQFAKSHLYDGMTTRTMNLPFIGAKRLANQVSVLDGDIQKALLPRSTIVSHRTLNEMAAVVELVRVDFLPFVCTPPS